MIKKCNILLPKNVISRKFVSPRRLLCHLHARAVLLALQLGPKQHLCVHPTAFYRRQTRDEPPSPPPKKKWFFGEVLLPSTPLAIPAKASLNGNPSFVCACVCCSGIVVASWETSEKELISARTLWRAHFDLLSNLDELGTCVTPLRLAEDGERLDRLMWQERR